MNDPRLMRLVPDKQTYISSYIEQNNLDTTTNVKSRDNKNISIVYNPSELLFNITKDGTSENVGHDATIDNVKQLTGVTDKHNNLVFSFTHNKRGTSGSVVTVNWYDEEIGRWLSKELSGHSPLLVTDEIRPNLLEKAEVILYYINNSNKLCYSLLSDRFTTVVEGLELRHQEKLVKIGITKLNRIQIETTRPVSEIVYKAMLGNDGLPILDKNRNPIWVATHHPLG